MMLEEKTENHKDMLDWFFQHLKTATTEHSIGLNALENLTVIIPSYERQDFLLRQLIYWRGAKVKLIIADGSKIPIRVEVLNKIQSQLHVTYLHNKISFSERLNMAAAHIETPYAVMSGDDEFLLKYGLCCAINKLQRDPSLAACLGQCLGIYLSGGLSESDPKISYGPGVHWRYEIGQGSQSERLRAAMTNYTTATCYAVLRADAWRRSWGAGRKLSSPYALEMQQAISTYLSGKLSTVDEVYWMRSHENKSVSIKGSNRTLSFEEWWTATAFKSERDEFVNTLALEATEAGEMDIKQAHILIVEVIELFLAPERQKRARLTGRAAMMTELHSSAGKILKTLLSEDAFIKLRNVVYSFRDGSYTSRERAIPSIGSFSDLSRLKDGERIMLDDVLLSEISNIEMLINSFYKIRGYKQ